MTLISSPASDHIMNNHQPVADQPVFGVTERALAKIQAERAKRGQPGLMFRVTVLGGGCSGLQYKFGYDEAVPQDDDIAYPAQSPAVLSDETSLRFLKGAVLDYEQDLMGSRFAIKNPNAVSGCGCGVSFSVDFSKM